MFKLSLFPYNTCCTNIKIGNRFRDDFIVWKFEGAKLDEKGHVEGYRSVIRTTLLMQLQTSVLPFNPNRK